jgi:ribonuclease P protein component
MRLRLPKSQRLKKGGEIREILIQGRKYTGNHLTLYVIASPQPALPQIRVAFLSPTRLGKAVQRNRVRRWMREAFRRSAHELVGSHRILMMGRASSIDAGYDPIARDFMNLCRKARLIASA